MSKRRGERVRPERVAEQIRADVAEILQTELRDPRLGLVTCTRVQVSSDLRNAKLYVSVLGDEAAREGTMKALAGATGFVRRKLSSKLGLRAAPDISFVYDPSVEYGIRLEALIEETKQRSPDSDDPDPD
jgi:ribosome-binding factor A